MADLNCPWDSDLQLGPTAGLAVVTGDAETQQRLARRLLTNPGDLLSDQTYGAGLGRFIGSPVNVPKVQAIIKQQALLEATIASVSNVTVTSDTLGNVIATVAYVDAAGTNSALTLSTASLATGF